MLSRLLGCRAAWLQGCLALGFPDLRALSTGLPLLQHIEPSGLRAVHQRRGALRALSVGLSEFATHLPSIFASMVSDVGSSGIGCRGCPLQHINLGIASMVGVVGPSGIERELPFAAHRALELRAWSVLRGLRALSASCLLQHIEPWSCEHGRC